MEQRRQLHFEILNSPYPSLLWNTWTEKRYVKWNGMIRKLGTDRLRHTKISLDNKHRTIMTLSTTFIQHSTLRNCLTNICNGILNSYRVFSAVSILSTKYQSYGLNLFHVRCAYVPPKNTYYMEPDIRYSCDSIFCYKDNIFNFNHTHIHGEWPAILYN